MNKQMWQHADNERSFRDAVVMALGMETDMHTVHVHVALEVSLFGESWCFRKCKQESSQGT